VIKKRREAQLVQLKIRIRERLRRHLEQSAKEREIPLTHEIVRRLEKSSQQDDEAPLRDEISKIIPLVDKAIARQEELYKELFNWIRRQNNKGDDTQDARRTKGGKS
jgi:DNA-binding transcriptional regulator GbsR (MarR family)